MPMYKPDSVLLWITGVLMVVGLILLSSASVVLSNQVAGNSYYYVVRQLILGIGGGIVAFLVAYFVPLAVWRRAAFGLFIFSIILLSLVFLPHIGHHALGAQRWLSFGGFTVQPSEITKMTFAIYLAALLSRKNDKHAKHNQNLMPFFVSVGVLAVLIIAQPDMGTLGVIALSSLILFFISGAKIQQVLLIILIGAVAAYVLVKVEPYRTNRLTVFLHPNTDKQGIGYQINQAFIAVGSGGIFGRGFGNSLQKYNYLPEPMSDSIYAIVVEELGIVGGLALLLVFMALFWRGLSLAIATDNQFYKLLAVGVSSVIIVQAFINIMAILGLIPLTGITLPFVSYGGSSYITMLFAIGILTQISRYATL